MNIPKIEQSPHPMKNLFSKYKNNEQANAHSENAALLADAYGTKTEQQQAHALLAFAETYGYAHRDAAFFQGEMSRKYYAKARQQAATQTQDPRQIPLFA